MIPKKTEHVWSNFDHFISLWNGYLLLKTKDFYEFIQFNYVPVELQNEFMKSAKDDTFNQQSIGCITPIPTISPSNFLLLPLQRCGSNFTFLMDRNFCT